MAQSGSSHIGEVEGEIHQDRVIACSILVMIVNGGTGNAMKNTILCAARVCAQVISIISHVFCLLSTMMIKPTDAIRVAVSPRNGVGPGFDSQGSVNFFTKYCFPNLH